MSALHRKDPCRGAGGDPLRTGIPTGLFARRLRHRHGRRRPDATARCRDPDWASPDSGAAPGDAVTGSYAPDGSQIALGPDGSGPVGRSHRGVPREPPAARPPGTSRSPTSRTARVSSSPPQTAGPGPRTPAPTLDRPRVRHRRPQPDPSGVGGVLPPQRLPRHLPRVAGRRRRVSWSRRTPCRSGEEDPGCLSGLANSSATDGRPSRRSTGSLRCCRGRGRVAP